MAQHVFPLRLVCLAPEAEPPCAQNCSDTGYVGYKFDFHTIHCIMLAYESKIHVYQIIWQTRNLAFLVIFFATKKDPFRQTLWRNRASVLPPSLQLSAHFLPFSPSPPQPQNVLWLTASCKRNIPPHTALEGEVGLIRVPNPSFCRICL